MIQLTTDFNTDGVYSETVFNDLITEINDYIRQNATSFRLVVEFDSSTLHAKQYKNALFNYYLYKGFKIVNHSGFIYIDWARPELTKNDSDVYYNTSLMSSHFTAKELYFSILDSDLREINYRTIVHKAVREVTKLQSSGLLESKVHFNITSNASGDILNSLFAGELKKINEEKLPETKLEWLTGTILLITHPASPEFYTGIDTHIIFGSRPIR